MDFQGDLECEYFITHKNNNASSFPKSFLLQLFINKVLNIEG